MLRSFSCHFVCDYHGCCISRNCCPGCTYCCCAHFSNPTFVLVLMFVSIPQPSLLRAVGIGCQQQVRHLNVHEYVSLGLMKEVSDGVSIDGGHLFNLHDPSDAHPFLCILFPSLSARDNNT